MRFDVRPAVLAPMVALALVLVGGACGGTSPQASGPTTSASSTTANASSTTGAPTAGAPTTTAPASTPAWLTYGGNFSRTSVDTSGPPFNRSVAAAWTSPDLDGAVYGEPLIDDGQVFVATENDTVYALSATNGTVVWSDHVGTPVPAGALPCGDITPDVGITSTMVIDPTSGTLFASGAEMHGGAVRHWVFAFDIATHRLLWSRDVDEPGWTASAQLQRTGLALSDGRVASASGATTATAGPTTGGWWRYPRAAPAPCSPTRFPPPGKGPSGRRRA
ncbi:MAG: PQQ-binding-like beta-propeller repeat protein [Acidimicrobiales bacterium]